MLDATWGFRSLDATNFGEEEVGQVRLLQMLEQFSGVLLDNGKPKKPKIPTSRYLIRRGWTNEMIRMTVEGLSVSLPSLPHTPPPKILEDLEYTWSSRVWDTQIVMAPLPLTLSAFCLPTLQTTDVLAGRWQIFHTPRNIGCGTRNPKTISAQVSDRPGTHPTQRQP